MIGYYVHHVGAGHLNRARAVARRSAHTVVGMSSVPAPPDWPGPWVRLARDDSGSRAVDPTAGGHLHWVPEGDDGLRQRMATLSSWIESARPDVLVSDVSAEVALLARLHGVPVVSVVLPGRRGDRAHRSAYAVSSALVAAWPREAVGMVHGLTTPTGDDFATSGRCPGSKWRLRVALGSRAHRARPARDVAVDTRRTSRSGPRRLTRPIGPGESWAVRATGSTTRPLPSTRLGLSWSRPARARWPTWPPAADPRSWCRPIDPSTSSARPAERPGCAPLAVPRGG